MMKATRTMYFDASPDEVLEFLFDDAIVSPGTTMASVYEAPDTVGSAYEWTFRVLGTTHRGVTIITDYVPGERLEFRNFGAFEGTAEWITMPENGGTRAIATVEARVTIPLVGRLFDPMLERMFDQELEFGKREFDKLRKEVVTAT